MARHLFRAFAALVAPIALSVTCAEPTAPVTVGSVTVSGSATNVIVGQTLQLTAEVRSDDNAVLTDRPVTWSANPAGVATVSNTGLVTTLTTGNVTVTATAGGVSGIYNIVVIPIPVATVEVTPATPTIIVGATQQLTATTKSSTGATLTGRVVTWISATPATATVSATGLVTGVAPGSVVITATSETINGTATVTVNPIPIATVDVTPALDTLYITQTTQLAAQPKSGTGASLNGRVVTWSSLDTLVAKVNATGLVTAMGLGTATIRATSEGVIGPATIVVVPVPVASVVVTPASDTILIGATTQLAAQARDSAGGVLAGRTFSWSTLDITKASVSASGLVTGIASGVVMIVATSEGKADTTSISVAPLPVDSVEVSPADFALHPTQTRQLTATTFDSTGAIQTGRIVTWSSSDTTVATVNASGLVLAVAPGLATITATSEGVNGIGELVVTAVPVSYIEASPANPIIVVGTTTQLSATPRDSVGGALARPVTWSSLDTAIATVSGSGLVTGVSVGYIGVVATSEGKSDTVVVDVNPVPVDSLFVSPAVDTILIGTTVQLAVTAFDSTGAVLTGRTVNWSSITNSSASVNASGLVTGTFPGTEQIRAHVITTSARGTTVTDTITALITVLPLPVDSIVIRLWNQPTEPTAFGTVKNAQTPLMALTYDSTGAVVFRQVDWSSTDTTLVAVNDTGLVTGVGTGNAYVIAVSEGIRDSVLVTSRVLEFTEVHAGPASTCALTTLGDAWCWGVNSTSDLGRAGTFDTALAIPVSGGLTYTSMSAGGKYTSNIDDGGYVCAIATGGALYCWGNNYRGTLGIGGASATPSTSPQLVVGGLTFTAVSAGNRNACGITADSSAYCWGLNSGYAVGDSTTVDRSAPTLVKGGHKWIQISAGSDYACGLVAGGAAYCWGNDIRGQLGTGDTPPGQCHEDGLNDHCRSPAPVFGGLTFTTISAGQVHTCGIATDTKTYCWGHNPYGQLGRGDISLPSHEGYETPQEVVGGHLFVTVNAAGNFTCAATAAGAVYCWGVNGNYELGNGTQTSTGTPVAVVGGVPMETLTSRGGNALGTCGMSLAGEAWCWGGIWQTRGTGTRTLNPVSMGPTKVLGQP